MKRKVSFSRKNGEKRTFTFKRPSSAKRISTSFLVNKNISTIATQPHPILMTNPNNSMRKLKGMGNTFEREELYKINMQLKETVNSLRVELYEAKSQIVKKEREIKNKEKIIEDCYKEIDNPTSLYKKSFDRAKESTLFTLCKEQYNQLKNNYDKQSEEMEILKANIKITKLKEYQINIDVLKKEMNKLRNLYNSLILENNMLKKQLEEFNEYKSRCNYQHDIINKCAKKVEDYNHNLLELELQNEELQEKLEKNRRSNQLIKNQNNKLKLTNEKYLRERKNRQHFTMYNTDKINKINHLEKELNEYKRLYKLTNEECEKMKKNMNKQKNVNVNVDALNAYNNNIQFKPQIEKAPTITKDDNKILLLKSILEEKQKNFEILKNFLINLHYDPDKIITTNNSYVINANRSNGFHSGESLTINNNISSIGNNVNINNNNFHNTNELSKNDFNNNNGSNNANSNNGNKNNSDNNNNINNDSKKEDKKSNEDNNNSQLYNAAVINDPNNSNDQEKESYNFPSNDNEEHKDNNDNESDLINQNTINQNN